MNCRSCVHFPICEYVESLGVGFKTLRIGSDAEKCVMFNNLKTIDAEPVRYGHWKEIQVCRIYNEDTVYSIGYKCNQCGRVESKKEPYCHCGAKMMDEVSE